ncbi:MAG: helix-turn-helix transcriptional regulator [Proteobacteria bacterium]|nr:helix-turn-helix transcriptional regulator [Pseudomonadota bacterium]MBU1060512.1 helix-turn-helix transcriptional regulator [Pseudomonadota bacterium]
MKLEWRLKQVMEQHNLYKFGVESQMAKDCGFHRHTVGKLLRNQVQTSKLEVLEKICGWLIERGVPAETLPSALFGIRPSGLWRAMGHSKKILIFLGEYHLKGRAVTTPQASPPVSISRHDSVVSSKIIHFLSTDAELRDTRPSVKMLYVPFYFTPGVSDVRGDGFTEDKDRARRIFENMRNDKRPGRSTILIGSQRVNYLVEYMVADLFNCEPFVPAEKEPKVPIYLSYRKFDRLVPSCFGGEKNPLGATNENCHGTYYLDENFKWQFLEWQRRIADAGIVIITREADCVEMAAFGFSGRSTNAIGNALLQKSEDFWPENGAGGSSTVVAGAKEIGIYVCQVEFSEQHTKSEDWAYENFENDVVKVIPLHRKVLEKFLKKR